MNFDIIIDILLILLIILSIFVICGYNALIKRQNEVEESESNIQIYLEKRFDLVPNLVEVVKGYTKHESETLTDVVKARQKYESKERFSVKDIDAADKSINQLVAIAENYPELKANTQYLDLSQKLSKVEDEIGRARKKYNRTAVEYNTKAQTVPYNAVAKMFNFQKKELFKLDSDEKKDTVSVKM